MSNGLGRGLSSLIPQKVKKVPVRVAGEPVVETTSQADKDKILQVGMDKIKVNVSQPRQIFNELSMQELTDSIKEYGIIQPLIVRKSPPAGGGVYELIAGERRLRAAKTLHLATVPVIVRDADEQQRLEVALIENLQRENLNPIETALAYRKLVDEFNLSHDQLAAKVGKARPTVTNVMRLLNLPEEIREALIAGKISEGHAKLIVGLDDEIKQLALYHRILSRGLTVDDTIKESRRLGGTKQARIKINYQDKDKEFAFREFFGTKVEVRRQGKGAGQVIIYFYSDEELGELVGKIKK